MRSFSTLRSVPVRAPLVLIIAIFLFGNIPLGNTQLLSNRPVTVQQLDSTFQSISDKFNITAPDGWVIEDVYSTDTYTLLEEMMQGSRLLAQICPRDQAIGDIEGNYDCEHSNESIYIQQYPNLADQSEFISIANSNIRNENLLDYHIMKLQKLGYNEISILHNTSMTIDVINGDTNKTMAVVPANLVEMRYNSPNLTDTRGYFMLAATNATSNLGITSGYVLSYEASAATLPSIVPPEPILRIFQSFEFVKDAREGAAATTTNTSLTLSTQEEEDDEIEDHSEQTASVSSGSTTTGVSMVPSSSSLTEIVYDPNPVQISTDDTIRWTNDDSQPHSATSGENAQADGRFDSGIMAPTTIFERTFTEPGEYPYFCILHPNMLGTVIVTEE
jgi:plastocyanin